MSTKHHIDDYANLQKRQKIRRLVVDVLFLALFLCAVGGVFYLYQQNVRVTLSEKQKAIVERDLAAEKDRATKEKEAKLEAEIRRVREEALRGEESSVATSAPLLPSDALTDPSSEVSSTIATSSRANASGTPEGISGFMRFEDVTAERYENNRLGFIMEIPSEWKLAYEHSDEVLLANGTYWFGVFLSDVVKKKEAMWVRIVRPCTSTIATSTIFAFATTTDTSIREATACVPPFLVTLGYRADATDYLGRERFLLSVGRTLYPIVSSQAPYAPLR